MKLACKMKGVNYNTLSNKPNAWRRPNGGKPDGILNNRVYWRIETIIEWMELDDEELRRRYYTEPDGR